MIILNHLIKIVFAKLKNGLLSVNYKSIVQEVGDTIQAIKPILNTATMGTLRGLAKDTMKRHRIKPDKRDKAATSVYRLKYNELEQVSKNRGGGGKTKKRRRRKN